ncbi:MAG TPA: PstS family phosphate ABC transporter substrate-binding protein [Pirellulales bacterium]|nr:PstS family phosphate ABC transporter substrate-binding protein [Pirellulales bacterium]
MSSKNLRSSIARVVVVGLVGVLGCSGDAKPPAANSAGPAAASQAPAAETAATGDQAPEEHPPAEAPAASEASAPAVEAANANASNSNAVEAVKDLPVYAEVEGVSGTIKSVGSDSMINLMTYWCEDFGRHYPSVQPEIEGKGSATAPPALTAGTANFGPMSRPMKAKEMDEFEAKFGYKPTALKTSIDMLAVYVHKDNPIKGLTFQQLDALFSKNRKGGYPKDIRTWGDLGLTGVWANKPISLYGRNSASGTNGYFKEHVLFSGDYKDSVIEQPGSSAVVQGVAKDKWGIGYSGIGYLTADVRAVPLAAEEGDDFVPAEPENAFSGEYPLSRYLYVYVNYKPGSELDPLRREFIKYIFSQEGQQDVVKDGYLPVKPQTASEALGSVGISTDE